MVLVPSVLFGFLAMFGVVSYLRHHTRLERSTLSLVVFLSVLMLSALLVALVSYFKGIEGNIIFALAVLFLAVSGVGAWIGFSDPGPSTAK